MATTMTTTSTHVLLLAMILMAADSVQTQHLSPPPAMAPSAAGGGHCPPDVVADLGVCVDLTQLGSATPENMDMCCRRIRAVSRSGGTGLSHRTPNAEAAVCVCAAFSISDANDGARTLPLLSDPRVNIVLAICGEAPVPGLACTGSLKGQGGSLPGQ